MLRGVEGHGKIIGDNFNRIESCTHEARKGGQRAEIVLPNPPQPAESEIAIVIGGAECWERDLEQARALIGNRAVKYYFINDQIKTFSEPGVAVTLHADKLNGHFAWLQIRRKAGLPEPEKVWGHRAHASVTHHTETKDWGGSSGLFAVQVARRDGYRKVIGCGVPMTVDGSHYIRHQKWQSAIAFRGGWVKCKNDLAPYFRSMSGWTREQFGEATEEWINGEL
jgi:hypothetical protein